MINTMHATAEGLLEWATQGRQYFVVKEDVNRALIPETLSVRDLYGAAIVDQSICDVWQHQDGDALKHRDITKISKTIQAYGAGFQARAANYNEECERELEKEVEKEVEVERQVPGETPKSETNWIRDLPADNFCQYSSVKDLPTEAQVLTLAQFMNQRSDHALLQKDAIAWPSEIFCTANFAIAIEASGPVTNHLRPLDSIVAFSNGEVLLISERESDCLLSMLQTTRTATTELLGTASSNEFGWRFSLWNWSYFRLQSIAGSPFQEKPASRTGVIHQGRVKAALQLFNGETSITDENREEFASLLQPATSKEVSKLLVEIRGLSFMFPYSDIDKITDEILSMART
jgi:hypothetical protein